MAFVACLEIVVNFDKFRNVDLLSQGLYCVAVSIGTEDGEVWARPVGVAHSETAGREGRYVVKPSPLYPREELAAEDGIFYTRTFYLRFLEQVECLDEVVTFRLECEATRLLKQDLLVATFDLLHLAREGMEALGPSEPIPRSKLAKVRTQKVPLAAVCAGLNLYVPVTFSDWYFGVVGCTFHTALLEFTCLGSPGKGHHGHGRGSHSHATAKYNNGKSLPFDQYIRKFLKAEAGLHQGTSLGASVLLFRVFVSYLLSVFFTARALYLRYTPKGSQDTGVSSVPSCLVGTLDLAGIGLVSSQTDASPAPAGGTAPNCKPDAVPVQALAPTAAGSLRCRIVSGGGDTQLPGSPTSKAYVLSPTSGSHPAGFPSSSHSPPEGVLPKGKSFPRLTLAALSSSMQSSDASVASATHSAPPHSSSSPQNTQDRFTNIADVARTETAPVIGGPVSPSSAPTTGRRRQGSCTGGTTSSLVLQSAFEKAQHCMADLELEQDTALFPFACETCAAVTESLVAQFQEHLSSAASASSPEELCGVLVEALSRVSAEVDSIWRKFVRSTLRSPAALVGALSTRFFAAERALALFAVSPPTPIPVVPHALLPPGAYPRLTCSTLFSFPTQAVVSFNETLPLGLRRVGLDFAPVPSITLPESPTRADVPSAISPRSGST
eukprot:RCo002446